MRIQEPIRPHKVKGTYFVGREDSACRMWVKECACLNARELIGVNERAQMRAREGRRAIKWAWRNVRT